MDAVRHIDYASASCKINLALSELPDFTAVPGTAPGPQHRGTIHISPTMEYIERAYDDAKYGRPSQHPIIEATIPSVARRHAGAREASYVMSMFTQYFPYNLAPGLDLETEKEKYADRCFDLMNQYAPNFKRSVIARQVLSPVDLEQRFGLTGGNIMQGVMSLSSLSFMRPVPGLRGLPDAGARTVHVRGGDASGRRRDGRVRVQRRAGDRSGLAGVGWLVVEHRWRGRAGVVPVAAGRRGVSAARIDRSA